MSLQDEGFFYLVENVEISILWNNNVIKVYWIW